ncbi:hypothetical protein UFOVP1522_61 [uncultured Caudovirales phage]|uniref:Uncharacterized protein n=1 Tax=uncultured Caudovirales phage TaxID=2100421 RepID=A0A6J5SAG5_9CAUD|nr:hypothetical protein UFOVP989_26 [uncultured Caudovirales phage]CAB4181465.1 hypothetical protein UFOVP1075_40 [uncultured Caudovirales phage]CAB4198741.1 hypothetical protein UFOVP1312_32 [uncultured Caudovirales phage]CAB4210617.1 hypothetical protein UFOVP1426_26 [uncultured Caudovirales phage]CAB5227590.1 hypothetical protein UFOVP1522_61 [uncultured Caudovirales phage]
MIFEWDDFGCDHIISDMCQSHDCRDQLDRLKELNPKFKATLFAIPSEMTMELIAWCQSNKDWIQLAVHGFFHSSNYECEKMSYDDFDYLMSAFSPIINKNFVSVFRAPGWQISDDIMKWLYDHNWIIADQGYNDARRPIGLKAFVNHDNNFRAAGKSVEVYHGHTWNVGWNGIYEDYDKVESLVKDCKEFKFVTEAFDGN